MMIDRVWLALAPLARWCRCRLKFCGVYLRYRRRVFGVTGAS